MPTQPIPRGWSYIPGSTITRVYDTNALWRHDEIIRIRHMEAEIADMQKEIDRQNEKAVAVVERFESTKKWLGIID